MNNKEKFKKYTALSEKFGQEAGENISDIIDLSLNDFKSYVDRRFKHNESIMNQKFDYIDKRFNSLNWGIGIAITFLTILMTLFKFI